MANRPAMGMGLVGVALVLLVAFMLYREHGIEQESEIQALAATAYKLRFGLNIPEGTALHAAAMRYADEVARRGAGRVSISVHPNQELGNDQQMEEMARRGELDILLIPTAKMGISVPAMQVVDLPFFFPSRQALYSALDGEPGRLLLGKLQGIGLIGVTFWENGFKHFTANTPLRDPHDFKDLKIRVMKTRIIMDQFTAMGATPISIDFHATRQALADGVVDGQENPLAAIVSMGFHEVQSHITLSEHAYLGYVFAISAASFDRLPPDIRTLLVDVARDLSPWERDETQRREAGFLRTIEATGVTIHHPTPEERKAFRQVLDHLPRQFEATIGADVISKFQEDFETRAASEPADMNTGKVAYVGLDAALSTQGAATGLSIKQGVELALHEINAAGGLLGHRIVLMARDHQGMPARGLADLEFFDHLKNLIAVIGGMHSTVVLAEVDYIQDHGLPFLVPWAAGRGIVDNTRAPDYVFRVSLSDSLIGPRLIDAALARSSKIAMVIEATSWGRENSEIMSNALQQRGSEAVLTKWINWGDTEFSDVVSDVQRSGAGVVVFVGNANEGARFFSALATLDSPPPVVSHWGIVGGGIREAVGPQLDRLDIVFPHTVFLDGKASEQVRTTLERYRSYFGLSDDAMIPAPAGFAHAYDLTHLLAKAVEKAGSFDHAAIRDALEKLPRYSGLVKEYAPPFAPDRHDALGDEVFHWGRFSADGGIVSAETPR